MPSPCMAWMPHKTPRRPGRRWRPNVRSFPSLPRLRGSTARQLRVGLSDNRDMIRSNALLFKHVLPFLALLCFALSGTASMAQTRIALLIGNNNYATAPLRNAVNDARDLSEA